jgi:hypothetical protein
MLKQSLTLSTPAPALSAALILTSSLSFEAEGDLMLSATLGLLLGLRRGVKVAGFSVDVALIDEPSIKGVAKVAANAGLNGDNKLDAGFTETNGCTGISTQMSWRNRVYVDLLSLKEFTIHDTKDNVLAQGCIKLVLHVSLMTLILTGIRTDFLGFHLNQQAPLPILPKPIRLGPIWLRLIRSILPRRLTDLTAPKQQIM